MEIISEKILQDAEQTGRFEAHDAEGHYISNFRDACTSYDLAHVGDGIEDRDSSSWSSWLGHPDAECPSPLPATPPPALQGRLQAIIHTSRPEHTSDQPDKLPFKDAATCGRVFTALQLPLAYLAIADGSLGIAHSHITRDTALKPVRFDLIVHSTSKQGDWALALSHLNEKRRTSALVSVELSPSRTSISDGLRMFQEYAFHPMVLPCIMFVEMLTRNVRGRFEVKAKISQLEGTLRMIVAEAQRSSDPDYDNFRRSFTQPRSIETLFELLHDCRREQSSREGRYELWRSFYRAIHEGFEYTEQSLVWIEPDRLRHVQSELKQWAHLTWRKFEKLKARDRDHMARVDNVSAMLYSVVQQRDGHIQASIARASQRDSEDMKFIAVLGSVFLPASLVAVLTVLNVYEKEACLGLNDDIDTTWFGVARDCGRHASLIADTRLLTASFSSALSSTQHGDETLYPSFASFFGETEAGKGTLIKLLINLSVHEDETFSTLGVGGAGKDVPVSKDDPSEPQAEAYAHL